MHRARGLVGWLLIAMLSLGVALCALPAQQALAATSYDVVSATTTVYLDDYDWLCTQGYDDDEPDYYVGATGSFVYIGEGDDVRYYSGAPKVMTVDSSTGAYKVVGQGIVKVCVYATNPWSGEEAMVACYCCICDKKPSSASLKSTSGTAYLCGSYDDEASVTISFTGMPSLVYYSLDVTSSGSSVYVSDFSYNTSTKKVSVEVCGSGSTTLKITLNGKAFSYKLKVKTVTLNSGQALVVKGKTKTLSLKNYSGSATWKSSNTKVATVNSSGKVTAKKVGTCIVYATINGGKVGCVVSVLTAKRYKVIKKAYSVAEGTYSQAKRMKSGYYDCSSLVWKAYSSQEGIYFGDKTYAPTAANNAKWCAKNGKKKISGGLSSSNIANLKLQAGDLFYRTGSDNSRYKGIYHVEMLTGYRWLGTSSSGKPILTLTWATRGDGYGVGCTELVYRP